MTHACPRQMLVYGLYLLMTNVFLLLSFVYVQTLSISNTCLWIISVFDKYLYMTNVCRLPCLTMTYACLWPMIAFYQCLTIETLCPLSMFVYIHSKCLYMTNKQCFLCLMGVYGQCLSITDACIYSMFVCDQCLFKASVCLDKFLFIWNDCLRPIVAYDQCLHMTHFCIWPIFK